MAAREIRIRGFTRDYSKPIGMYSRYYILLRLGKRGSSIPHRPSLFRERSKGKRTMSGEFLCRGTFWRGNFYGVDSGHLHIGLRHQLRLIWQIDMLT
jgi:hypothetical protein